MRSTLATEVPPNLTTMRAIFSPVFRRTRRYAHLLGREMPQSAGAINCSPKARDTPAPCVWRAIDAYLTVTGDPNDPEHHQRCRSRKIHGHGRRVVGPQGQVQAAAQVQP